MRSEERGVNGTGGSLPTWARVRDGHSALRDFAFRTSSPLHCAAECGAQSAGVNGTGGSLPTWARVRDGHSALRASRSALLHLSIARSADERGMRSERHGRLAAHVGPGPGRSLRTPLSAFRTSSPLHCGRSAESAECGVNGTGGSLPTWARVRDGHSALRAARSALLHLSIARGVRSAECGVNGTGGSLPTWAQVRDGHSALRAPRSALLHRRSWIFSLYL